MCLTHLKGASAPPHTTHTLTPIPPKQPYTQAAYSYVRNMALGTSSDVSEDGSIMVSSGTGVTSGLVTAYRIDPESRDVTVQLGDSIAWPDAYETLGQAVAISGDGSTIVASTGLYVSVYTLVGGTTWQQKGTPINRGAYYVGNNQYTVGISYNGGTIVLGSPTLNTASGTRSGAVRVYDWSGGAWALRGEEIQGKSQYEWLGYSVGISSDSSRVAMGGVQPSYTGSAGGPGVVRVYQWSGSAWQQVGADITGPHVASSFGHCLSISPNGGHLVVGSPQESNGALSYAGGARAFRWDGGSWQQMGSAFLGTEASQYMAWDVDISSYGMSIIIASPYKHLDGMSDVGEVQVYMWDPVAVDWVIKGPTIRGTHDSELLGSSVAISEAGDVYVIGSIGFSVYDTNAGRVQAYICSFLNLPPLAAPPPAPLKCSGCGDECMRFTSMSGSFTDGSGDSNYPNNADCEWQISVGEGNIITLSVDSLDLEQGYDFLKVYTCTDSSCSARSLIATLDGTQTPGMYPPLHVCPVSTKHAPDKGCPLPVHRTHPCVNRNREHVHPVYK